MKGKHERQSQRANKRWGLGSLATNQCNLPILWRLRTSRAAHKILTRCVSGCGHFGNDIALACLKSLWKSDLGSMFQAMVSVIAVKIQLSSPRGVLRSVCLPGMRSMSSLVSPSCLNRLREQNQRNATCTRCCSFHCSSRSANLGCF